MKYDDEQLDVVNEQDEVIGKALQKEIYEKRPLHRIVHVVVKNSKGEFGLQLRSARKSYKPLHWATSACGHPHAGETYKEGAKRETKEELRIDVEPENFRRLFYEDSERPGLRRFLGVFEVVYDGEIHLNPEEVEKFKFVTRIELQEMINRKEPFHPEFLFILTNLYGFMN